jgi:hypothetical protein
MLISDSLHTNEETTLLPFAAGPLLDQITDGLPSAQIEVTDAKIRPTRKFKRLP